MKNLFVIITLSLLLISCSEDESTVSPTQQPPTSPELTAPLNGGTDVVVSPVLTWKPSASAFYYMLQVSESDSFDTFVYDQNVGNVTSKKITGLALDKRYYWRVNATNVNGTSAWSVFSFRTGFIPGSPALSNPADNAQSLSNPPTFRWKSTTGATNYRLQVSTMTSFLIPVYNQDVGSDTSMTVTNLNNNVKYYWRVSASNAHGTSPWSEVRDLSMGQIPAVPTLAVPMNHSWDEPLTLTLSWNAASGAADYTLQCSKSSSFTSYIFNSSVGNVLSKEITGLEKDASYYWRVRAWNTNGSSAYSEVWAFSTLRACGGITFVNYQGKMYTTQKIANQCWLKENLNIGTRINGDHYPGNNGTVEKYCHSNDENNCTKYGGLYYWDEAMQYSTTEGAQGICPAGWHIPKMSELFDLKAAVDNDGNALKAIGEGYQQGAGTNTSGFSALLGGYRYALNLFGGLDAYAVFWSSGLTLTDHVWGMTLSATNSTIEVQTEIKSERAFSIRCIKDE